MSQDGEALFTSGWNPPICERIVVAKENINTYDEENMSIWSQE